jgi:CcmD family protein
MEQGTRQKGQGKREKAKGKRGKRHGKREKGQGAGLALAAILCSLFAIAGSAQAQPARPDPRSNTEIMVKQPPSPPDGFVPAGDLLGREQLPAAPLVIGAYAVAWVAVFGYLWSIWKRIGRVEQELADVSRRLAAGERR